MPWTVTGSTGEAARTSWWSGREAIPAQAEEAFVFEFKQGNSAANTSLEELAQAAYAQAVEGYLDGVREKWHPKEILVLGIGFRGKDLSLYCEA